MALVISGPDATRRYQLAAMRAALRLEVRTRGMLRHSRGSVLAAVNRTLGTAYRRKVDAIAALDAILDGPPPDPAPETPAGCPNCGSESCEGEPT